jgi:hypothetical protein
VRFVFSHRNIPLISLKNITGAQIGGSKCSQFPAVFWVMFPFPGCFSCNVPCSRHESFCLSVDVLRFFYLISHVKIHKEKTKHKKVNENDFKVLGQRYRTDFRRKISEALFIKTLKPDLNVKKESYKLALFNWPKMKLGNLTSNIRRKKQCIGYASIKLWNWIMNARSR